MPQRHDPSALLAAFSTRSSPALTWYGEHERTELSGAVLARWVAKSANYLLDDLNFGAGSVLYLDLPVTWRSYVFTHAAWLCGGAVTFREVDDADVIVTDRPAQWATQGGDVLAVALPALALSFDGELPTMAIDANAEIMGAADLLGPMPPAEASQVALAGPNLRFADLSDLLAGGSARRIMIRPTTSYELVRQLASQLLAGGSVVALDPRFMGDCAAVADQEQAVALREPCR